MTNLAVITTETVEASLKAARTGQTPDSNLLTINWSGDSIPEQNILALEKLMQNLIWDTYAELRQAEEFPPTRPVTRQELLKQIKDDFQVGNSYLEAWSALYFRYIAPLDISAEELSRAASVVPQQFRRRMQLGLALLVQQLRRKAPRTGSASHAVLVDLPVPDFTRLIGHENYVDQLHRLFEDESGPGIISLEGMGGIGKSALARAFIAVPEVRQRWKRIIWVSARQAVLSDQGRITSVLDAVATLEDISVRLCNQLGLSNLASKTLSARLEGLRDVLSQDPHLVIIDNLETVEEYRSLVPALGKMTGLSRFLITSRQTLRDFDFVYTLPVKELDQSSAHELLQSEVERRGRSTAISADHFNRLYQIAGGLPLALKLAAAQLQLKPLEMIVEGFLAAKSGIDGLYHFLYWQTWNALADPARRLLLSFLPADPEGEDVEFLRIMSGQSDDDFYTALHDLDQFSLLEMSGDAAYPRYRLHRLTVTFLQTDILKLWSDPSGYPQTPDDELDRD
jgi:hypothetical protein